MKLRYLILVLALCGVGWAQPNIGAMQNLPNVFTSTNTFQGQVFLPTLANGCLALTAGLVVSQPCGQTSFALISSGVNTFATMNCGSGCSLLASGSGTIVGTGLLNQGNSVVLNGTGITWTDLNGNFISSSSSTLAFSFGGGGAGLGAITLSNSSSGASGAVDISDGSGDSLIFGATGSRAWNINLSNANITAAFLNTTGGAAFLFGSPLNIGVNPNPGTTSPSISNGFLIASTGTSAVGPQTLFSQGGYSPTAAGLFGYDSTNNRLTFGTGTQTGIPIWLTTAPTNGSCPQFTGTLGQVVVTNCVVGPQYAKLRCEDGYNNLGTAIPAGTTTDTFCYNDSGVTWTITGIKCYADAGSPTLNASGHTLGSLLTGAITCTTAFAAGTQTANVALTSGDYINFTFVADGTATRTTWVVSMSQ